MRSQTVNEGYIGRLLPTNFIEVCPGDTWSGKIDHLIRLSPLKRAVLNGLFVDTFLFYVPHRLIWDDWENFLAEGPQEDPTYTFPTVVVTSALDDWKSGFMPYDDGSTSWSARQYRTYNFVLRCGMSVCESSRVFWGICDVFETSNSEIDRAMSDELERACENT